MEREIELEDEARWRKINERAAPALERLKQAEEAGREQANAEMEVLVAEW